MRVSWIILDNNLNPPFTVYDVNCRVVPNSNFSARIIHVFFIFKKNRPIELYKKNNNSIITFSFKLINILFAFIFLFSTLGSNSGIDDVLEIFLYFPEPVPKIEK